MKLRTFAVLFLVLILAGVLLAQTGAHKCPICGQTAPATGRTRQTNGQTECEYSHQYGYGPNAQPHTFWADCQ